MIKITGPKTLTIPTALGGDDSVYGLVLVCATRGIFVEVTSPDTVALDGLTDTTLLTPSVVALLVSKGAEVHGYPAYFEIDDITAACPFSDSNETWENWGVYGESHVPVQIGEKWYRSSCIGASGEPLLASEWVALMPGLTVLSEVEYRNLGA